MAVYLSPPCWSLHCTRYRTHSSTWRAHKRVAFYLEIWHISYMCEETLATLSVMKTVNFANRIENEKLD